MEKQTTFGVFAATLLVYGGAVRADTQDGLEEIVVTAQKRSEKLIDVPSSITVIGGQQLEKTAVSSLIDFNGLVPGLTVTSGGTPGQTYISLRGIADTTTTALVGLTIDDVPIGSSSSRAAGSGVTPADMMPYDVERIEVLNGPQGTLYGSSAMGGLLKYVLKDPELESYDGRAGLVLDYIDHSAEPGGAGRAAVNLPLVKDVLAFRASGYSQKNRGFLDNVGLDEHHYNSYTESGGRVAGLWKPADTLSIKLAVSFQNIDAQGSSNETVPSGGKTGVPVDPFTLQPVYGPLTQYSAVPTPFSQRAQLYSLLADWDLGFASAKSITGWQHSHSDAAQDLTYGNNDWRSLVSSLTGQNVTDAIVPYYETLDLKKITEEVRLASKGGERFEWLFGGFFTHESSLNSQRVFALTPTSDLIPGINPFYDGNGLPSTYRELAIFTNDTLRLADRFSITAGVRHSDTRQVSSGIQYGYLFGSSHLTIENPAADYQVVSSGSVTTWMVSPEWHVSSDVMLYGRVATGYRAGGPTNAPAGSGAPLSYNADTLTNYEVGFKGALLDKRLNVTAALYDIEWKNIQVLLFQPGTNLQYLGNGKTARSRGAESGISYSVAAGLQMGLTASYTDAQLTADAPGIHGVDGARLPFGAKLSGAITADYKHPLAKDLVIQAGADYKYQSSVWDRVSSDPSAILRRQPHPADMYIGVVSERLDTRLYMRNIFNSQPSVQALANPSAHLVFDSVTYTPIQPRTVGVSVDVTF